MRILAVIPARGGSKGLPGKNLRELAGRPLIAHTILCAAACPSLTRTIVSTDDEAIARVAREYGADVPWPRPAELATDTAPTWGVLRHALTMCEEEEGRAYDALVLLQPTSPLRQAEDVEGAITLFQRRNAAAVVSVCELEHPIEWVMRVDDKGAMRPVCAGADFSAGRQAHERLYRLNGAVYVYRRDALTTGDAGAALAAARAWPMPAARSVDIDTARDFALAEAMLQSGAEGKMSW